MAEKGSFGKIEHLLPPNKPYVFLSGAEITASGKRGHAKMPDFEGEEYRDFWDPWPILEPADVTVYAMAELAGLVVMDEKKEFAGSFGAFSGELYTSFTSSDEFRFSELDLNVEVESMKGRHGKAKGTILQKGKLAAKINFDFRLLSPKSFRKAAENIAELI